MSWTRSHAGRAAPSIRRQARRLFQPKLEALEDRTVPSAYTFTKIVEFPSTSGIQVSEAAINNLGQAVFEADSSTLHAIYVSTSDPAAPTLVAKTGDPIPGTGRTISQIVTQPAINDAGTVVFHVTMDNGWRALLTWSGGPLVAVTRGDTGINPTSNRPDINNTGTVAFLGGGGIYVVPADGSAAPTLIPSPFGVNALAINDSGVIAYRISGTETTFSTTNGTTTTTIFTGTGVFSQPSIGNNGTVIFLGGGPSVRSVYTYDGTLHAVASAPSANFSLLDVNAAPSVNADGSFLFYARTATDIGLFSGPDPVADGVVFQSAALDGEFHPAPGLFSKNGLNDIGQFAIPAFSVVGQTRAVFRANPVLPTLSISNATVTEGNSGTTNATFTVTLSATSTKAVTVSYATADGSATTADNDYTAISGTLTFAPGETSKTITVAITGDTKFEPDETFSVNLSGAAHATIATGTGTGTIQNDDFNQPPVLSGVPASVSIPELIPYTFTATATDPNPGETLTFSLQGTVPMGAGIDASSGVFTWTPGEAQGPGSYTFKVRVTDNGSPSLFDEKTITLNVTEVNLPPVLSGVPASALVPVQTSYTFTATAVDPDLPANTLAFSLVGAPAGAAIDSTTGVFTWTPTAAQAGSYTFKVRVTDTGSLYDEKPLTLTVYRPNSLSGFVYLDDNNNGVKDALEVGIPGVTVTLTGTDDLGNAVGPVTMATAADGSYTFPNLRPGTYSLTETQPIGYQDGKDAVGTINGVLANDLISSITLKSGDNGSNYNFGELATTAVHKGQTATIGFWNGPNGQALIKSFGPTAQGQSLANWLAGSFPNLFGNLAGKGNAEVAAYFQLVFSNAKLFNQAADGSNSGMKLEAQVLGTALSVFASTQSLGGTTAAAYGFEVTEAGLGAASYNVAAFGNAFGLANNTTVTILQLLQITDRLTVRKTISNSDPAQYGVVYGGDATQARLWRPIVNAVFDDINNLGEIS